MLETFTSNLQPQLISAYQPQHESASVRTAYDDRLNHMHRPVSVSKVVESLFVDYWFCTLSRMCMSKAVAQLKISKMAAISPPHCVDP
jgi:hypothetical protein